MNKIILIFRKEVVDFVRDRRSFVLSLAGPIVVYPLIFLILGYTIRSQKIEEEARVYDVVLAGSPGPSPVLELFRESSRFRAVSGGDPGTMLERGAAQLAVETFENDGRSAVVIYYDGAKKESKGALQRAHEILSDYREALVRDRIMAGGLQESVLEPFTTSERNVSSALRMGGSALGDLIPYLLILISFMGALSIASDITAGEKERKTLETILVTDTRRGDLVLGKTLAVFSVSLLATVSGLIGLIVTFYSGFSLLTAQEELPSLSIPWPPCLLMFLVALPLLWLFSSVLIAIGILSRNSKEANTYSAFLYIFVSLFAVFSVLRTSSPPIWLFLVPILNTPLLQQQILIGETHPLPFVITILSSVLYALAAFLVARTMCRREEILFRR